MGVCWTLLGLYPRPIQNSLLITTLLTSRDLSLPLYTFLPPFFPFSSVVAFTLTLRYATYTIQPYIYLLVT